MDPGSGAATLGSMSFPPAHQTQPLHVVIAGGGVGALETAVALRTLAPGAVTVTVVADTDRYVERPLTIGEPFGLGPVRRHSLSEICSSLGARLVCDRVVAVSTAVKRLQLASGAPLGYDVLVMALGARRTPAFEHGVAFDRELEPEDFDDVLADLDDGLAPRIAFVVPDGVLWTLPAYELAVLTAARAAARGADDAVLLVTHEQRPLEAFGGAASDAVARVLDAHGVALRTGVHADVVTPTAMRAGGGWIEADRIVALPRTDGLRIPGLPSDEHGFLPVDDLGQVIGVDDVYAAGDGTDTPIKQGGLAAQQADAIAGHIAARVGAAAEVRPAGRVLRGLLRTPDGPLFLRAELDDPEGTSAFGSEPLWWPPSKIASRRLGPHLAQLETERRMGYTALAR